MDQKVHTLKSWEFYQKSMKILGEKYLFKKYSRKRTCIFKWGANPKFCKETRRNPIDRLKDHIKDICDNGYEDIAVAAVNIMLEDIGYEACPIKLSKPNHTNIMEECFDDYPKLIKFHEFIRKKKIRKK